MSPLERDSRFDELARLVSEGIPRRAALRRIGTFVAALRSAGRPKHSVRRRRNAPRATAAVWDALLPDGVLVPHRPRERRRVRAPRRRRSARARASTRAPMFITAARVRRSARAQRPASRESARHTSPPGRASSNRPGNDTPPADNPPAPTCTDGVKNGAETDVDCGGGTCPACANGKTCLAGTDCASGVCTNGVCVAPAATCTDGIKNHGETDVDCGGPNCPGCADGKTCAAGTDCASGRCVTGTCTAKLADGQSCSAANDCASGAVQ